MKQIYPLRLIRYVVAIAILCLAVFGLHVFFHSKTLPTYEAPMTPVRVTKPEIGTIEKSIVFSGHVEADAMIPVVPLVQGTLLDYFIEEGSKVEKDQVLAKIDDEVFKSQLAQAKAAYLAYESSYKRVSELNKIGAATDQELDTLTAQRDASKAQLELAELQLSYSEVKAPVSGTVLKNMKHKGDIATNTAPMAVIADLDKLEVNLQIPEKYFALFNEEKREMEITITRPTDGATSTAHIISVAPYIDGKSKTFALKLGIDNPELFRPGMYIKASIVYDKLENSYILPQKLRKPEGSMYAVVDGKALYINENIEFENNEYFLVPKGYENSLFIVDGQNTVLDGESVSILED
ncbi:MAG: efflux RND transporter periplasmic adaptor subunit [Sphaerochaetaceae bacterium]|nr:efflux RND transporter periplasmic adaptor subunit [Sphaerochaetaceae bacterium]